MTALDLLILQKLEFTKTGMSPRGISGFADSTKTLPHGISGFAVL